MKFAVAAALVLCASSLLVKQDPVMDSMKDSFGKSNLEPACAKIECGEYECPSPFELKVDNTCCGYCYAPDHIVAVDRHVAVPFNSTGNIVAQCESAPSTCKGLGIHPVRCFKPSCRPSDVPHCGPTSCCPICR